MFKGLSGLKKAVKGGFSAVAEHSSQLAEQVVGDPSTSKEHLKESIKRKVQGGVASVVDVGETVLNSDPNNAKEKVGEVAHNIKHYAAFGEDYLGYSDPTKDLRKAVKQKEKAAKKARKAQKKKTGKKEDLFDPENLAKYKRELELKKKRQEEAEETEGAEAAAAAEQDGEERGAERLNLELATAHSDSDATPVGTPLRTPQQPTPPAREETDDWKAFQSLTTGVDFLIKKTQDELGELKKVSEFVKKEGKVVDKTAAAEKERRLKQKKKWVDLDSGSFEEFDGAVEHVHDETHEGDGVEEVEQQQSQEEQEQEPVAAAATLFAEPLVEEEPVDPDADDDLFNTDFVNAITRGDVKLAVIPDSPTYEDEDDPFNTAIADVIVKKQVQEQKQVATRLKFTGLSAVADVLSGKTDKIDKSAVEVTVKQKRRRANRINLIASDDQEVTALEDIDSALSSTVSRDHNSQVEILLETLQGESLSVTQGDLLRSTPSPCPTSSAIRAGDEKQNVDLSEFEVFATKEASLTSNVAILSGEFAQPIQLEEDDFDAAFDVLAQESVTKAKLEELEKEFENDDIFDTTSADKVLRLASLIDKVEEEAAIEETFEDPFDTSAYDQIAGEVETDLEFESLANRQIVVEQGQDPSAAIPEIYFPEQESSSNEGWAFTEPDGRRKPPPRPAPPRPAPKRPRPPIVYIDPASRPETPSVVVKAASNESIKSWNCSVAETLIRKSEKEAADALLEHEDEYEDDPFDTTEFEEVAGKSIANFEDPFDTSAVDQIIDNKQPDEVIEDQKPAEQEEEEEDDDNEEEEVPDPFDILTSFDDGTCITDKPIKPRISSQEVADAAAEADPFDTSFAADILPNKGDPFNTSFVSDAPGKAEIKALEEEFLSSSKRPPPPPIAGRARPKSSSKTDLGLKKIIVVDEQEEPDPFDTSIADKIIPENKIVGPVSVEDDDFDPTKSFERSKSVVVNPIAEAEELDPFDTRAANAVLTGEEECEPAVVPGAVTANEPTSNTAVVKADSFDSDDFDPRAS